MYCLFGGPGQVIQLKKTIINDKAPPPKKRLRPGDNMALS